MRGARGRSGGRKTGNSDQARGNRGLTRADRRRQSRRCGGRRTCESACCGDHTSALRLGRGSDRTNLRFGGAATLEPGRVPSESMIRLAVRWFACSLASPTSSTSPHRQGAPSPFEASARRPPTASARRQRFADIRVTRKRFTTSRSLTPASISSAAANRTCSRWARSSTVSPPSRYLMTPGIAHAPAVGNAVLPPLKIAAAAGQFLAGQAASGGPACEWYGDSAYGTGDLRAAISQAGHIAVIKPGPLQPAVAGGSPPMTSPLTRPPAR
jgi:hypothetical protein